MSTTEIYNHEAIQQMLAAGFNTNDLDTLIFEYFFETYDSFQTFQRKPEKIQEIVEIAGQHDLLGAVIAYTKHENHAQYQHFVHQLYRQPIDSPTGAAAGGLTATNRQRLRDAQIHLERELRTSRVNSDWLTAFKTQQEVLRYEAKIQNQRKRVMTTWQEVKDIAAASGLQFVEKSPQEQGEPDFGSVEIRPTNAAGQSMTPEDKILFMQLLDKLSDFQHRSAGVMRQIQAHKVESEAELQRERREIVARFDPPYQQIVRSILDRLEPVQVRNLSLLLQAAAQQAIAQWQIQALAPVVQAALRAVEGQRRGQTGATEWPQILARLENEARWDEKFKLMLLIIPVLLRFEDEIAADVLAILGYMWRQLVAKIE